MNDFEGLLPSDYGFKPSSNKSAPISGSRSTRPASNSFSGSLEPDSLFAPRSTDFASSDILGGSARRGARSPPEAYDFDSVFDKRSNSEPVYDKPVYDDEVGGGGIDVGDIFSGVPGIRTSTAAAATSSSKVKFDDVFSSVSSSPPKRGGNVSAFDDLLGGFGKAEAVPPRWKSSGGATRPEKSERSVSDFDDLLQGFGASSLPTERSTETFANSSKTTSKVMEDPFVSTGKFTDPLEEISKFSNTRTVKSDSVGNGRLFDDVDPFDGLVRPASSFSSERENRGKETSNLRTESNNSGTQPFTTREVHEKPSVRSPDNQTERKVPVENGWDSNQTIFDIPTASTDTYKSFGQTMSPPSYASASASFKDSNTHADRSPRSEEDVDSSNDIWISVSEVPLVTQLTSAPPPSRPPPPKPVSKTSSSNATRRTNNEFSSFPNPSQNPNPAPAAGRIPPPVASPIDEFEDFARGTRDEHVDGLSGEDELEMNSVAAAMKEAMDRAQAKFRQAKEVRERENTKATRTKEGHHQERDEKFAQDERARERQERSERQRLQREKEEEERERQRLEREREEAEEREREQRRIEKERERERARQAVERATREARERAAADARQKAERAKAERAAVDKVTGEARERAERVAVQRAQAEARERAAAEAKERAERVAAEAKEKEARERAATARAEAEARARAAERAAVGRAAAEARERAAVDARDRAAAAARAASQQKNENDIESFFSSRASSAPRPSTTSSADPFFDTRPQTKRETEAPRAPSGNSSNIKKASSSTNIVDDLSSIFGAPAPGSASGDFQDREGETDERRRARLERHQRTQERAAKALAEKNQRDLQMQREQAETSRIGETLDVEIKRWAAGKEGNLRALLSTLQYVLWPESGWQAVSLTDLITAVSVKKVYRKATLCIHPDKVQQKGANLQQKYVAGKVFDLLKEAWNKFNSEELF